MSIEPGVSALSAASSSSHLRRRARAGMPPARAAKPSGIASAPDEKPATTPAHSDDALTPRLGALTAAAKVLGSLPAKEAAGGLSTGELIERMAAAKLWVSPGGKTPAATLYAGMIREIAAKNSASRFMRAGPGRFTLALVAAAKSPREKEVRRAGGTR